MTTNNTQFYQVVLYLEKETLFFYLLFTRSKRLFLSTKAVHLRFKGANVFIKTDADWPMPPKKLKVIGLYGI